MTHSTKYTCTTSEKCGTRPRAWNGNTKAQLVQDTTLCPKCGAHTYRPGLENSLSQRADKPTFSRVVVAVCCVQLSVSPLV
jgi:hypothetical protein